MTLEPLIISSDQPTQGNTRMLNAWMLNWKPSHIDELQARTVSSGWQWWLADAPDSVEVDAVGKRLRARYNEAKSRTGRWSPPVNVLLAVGSGRRGAAVTPELEMVVRLGRSVGISVVVAPELSDCGRSSAEFRSHITGYWTPFLTRTACPDVRVISSVRNLA